MRILLKRTFLIVICTAFLMTSAVAQQTPTTANDYVLEGVAAQRAGNQKDAVTALKREIKPTFTQSLYNLAHVYMKQGRFDDAIPPLQKLLQIEPKHAFANHGLGRAYALTNNRVGAMQQYHILKDIDPRLAADLLAEIPK